MFNLLYNDWFFKMSAHNCLKYRDYVGFPDHFWDIPTFNSGTRHEKGRPLLVLPIFFFNSWLFCYVYNSVTILLYTTLVFCKMRWKLDHQFENCPKLFEDKIPQLTTQNCTKKLSGIWTVSSIAFHTCNEIIWFKI